MIVYFGIYSFRRYVSDTMGRRPGLGGFWTKSRLTFRRRENTTRSPVIAGLTRTKATDRLRSRLNLLPFVSDVHHTDKVSK